MISINVVFIQSGSSFGNRRTDLSLVHIREPTVEHFISIEINSPVIVTESFTCLSVRDIFFVRFLNQAARIKL